MTSKLRLKGRASPAGGKSEPISMKPKPDVALSSWRSRTTSRDSYSRPEMPGDAPAEIPLPDVEGEADRAIGMGGLEFRRTDLEVIEMAVGVGQGRRADRPAPGRQGQVGRTVGRKVEAVRLALAHRVDHVHAVVGGTGADAARGRRQPDRLGLVLRAAVRRLRIQPKSGPARAALGRKLDHVIEMPLLPLCHPAAQAPAQFSRSRSTACSQPEQYRYSRNSAR